MPFIHAIYPYREEAGTSAYPKEPGKFFAQSGVNARSDSCELCAGKFRNFQRNSHFSLHRMQQNVPFFPTGVFSGRVFGSLATGALATTSLETNKTKTTKENTYEDEQ
jgi:hypothetical protein